MQKSEYKVIYFKNGSKGKENSLHVYDEDILNMEKTIKGCLLCF